MGDNHYKNPIGKPTIEQLKMLLKENKEKEKWANELIIANQELTFRNAEKEKRASELTEANNYLKTSLISLGCVV